MDFIIGKSNNLGRFLGFGAKIVLFYSIENYFTQKLV